MNNKFPAILALGLLTGPLTAHADLVQSATGAIATFRQCVSAETACNSVGPILIRSYGGRPGESTASTRQMLRRDVIAALARSTGPTAYSSLQLDDERTLVGLAPIYVWQAMLPNGEPVHFTTPTPELAYAGLVEPLLDSLLSGGVDRWMSIDHSPACVAAGVGCICQPGVTRSTQKVR